MKQIPCPSCGTLLAHQQHPGILINKLASLATKALSLKDQIARLKHSKDRNAATALATAQKQLAEAEAELQHWTTFRDTPES